MLLTQFSTLTFDCYGTLIDWEMGIHTALEPLLARAGRAIGRDEALETYADHESRQEEATPAMLYSDLLATVHRQLAKQWGLEASEEEARRFGQSVPDWPAFADTAASLRYLKKHYKLVILSNVDRTSFDGSLPKLGVEFDAVYTAQDIGSYKPSLANFAYMLSHLKADLGVEKPEILHTAQSLFHDHVPANQAGLATAWINRRHEDDGWGATRPPPAEARLDFQFDSLDDLVRAHQDAVSG